MYIQALILASDINSHQIVDLDLRPETSDIIYYNLSKFGSSENIAVSSEFSTEEARFFSEK